MKRIFPIGQDFFAAPSFHEDVDYNICPNTKDHKHVPEQGPWDPDFYKYHPKSIVIQCAQCGLTTGVPIPTEIEWN